MDSCVELAVGFGGHGGVKETSPAGVRLAIEQAMHEPGMWECPFPIIREKIWIN